MAEFKEAFENTLGFEDAGRSGVVTRDAGGRTRFGIAEKFHPDLPEDFFTGPADGALGEAEKIEERDYWSAMRLGEITSQAVANKLFDMAVNMGVRQASVLAQRAVNGIAHFAAEDASTPSRATPARDGDPGGCAPAHSNTDAAEGGHGPAHSNTGAAKGGHAPGLLSEDGVVGSKTMAAINAVDPVRYLQVLRELCVEFYRQVASLHPAEAVDLKGWLRRAEA